MFAPAYLASPVYGESTVSLRYYTCELLWRPIGQLMRFVWVEHPTRGRLIPGSYGYHFWMKLITQRTGARVEV